MARGRPAGGRALTREARPRARGSRRLHAGDRHPRRRVDVALTHAAREAWLRYGKGRSPAGLDFGDCFSYALATTTGRPLLYKGDDFAQTAVTPATA